MILRVWHQTWSILLILAAWQIWVSTGTYNSIVMVPPLAVFRDIVLSPRVYVGPALWTAVFGLGGLALGMTAGTLLAVLGWYSEAFSGVAGTAALLLSSTPVVCLIPLLARIFGYKASTELVTVMIMTMFPSFVYASQGLRKLPHMSDELFAVLHASRRKRLFLLALPAAAPNLAVALRVCAASSVLVAVVSEFLMQTGGLGALFAVTMQELDIKRALGASIVAMVLSAVFYTASGALEQKILARSS